MKSSDNYFINCNGKVTILDLPVGMSTEDWNDLQDSFARFCGKDPTKVRVTCDHLYADQCRGNIYWSESLGSNQGMAFVLFPKDASVRPGEFATVKSHLRATRDVVHIQQAHADKWVEGFTWSKREITKHAS